MFLETPPPTPFASDTDLLVGFAIAGFGLLVGWIAFNRSVSQSHRGFIKSIPGIVWHSAVGGLMVWASVLAFAAILWHWLNDAPWTNHQNLLYGLVACVVFQTFWQVHRAHSSF